MIKIHKNTLVYLIKPLCHGGGPGWCGQQVLGRMRLGKALKTKNKNWTNWSGGGSDERVRICVVKDVNFDCFVFNADEQSWQFWGKGKYENA